MPSGCCTLAAGFNGNFICNAGVRDPPEVSVREIFVARIDKRFVLSVIRGLIVAQEDEATFGASNDPTLFSFNRAEQSHSFSLKMGNAGRFIYFPLRCLVNRLYGLLSVCIAC